MNIQLAHGPGNISSSIVKDVTMDTFVEHLMIQYLIRDLTAVSWYIHTVSLIKF